jgi:hypothetical protein
MVYKKIGPLCLLFVASVLFGCAGSGETVQPASPASEEAMQPDAAASAPAAVGVWAYEVDSPQGIYRGTLTITETAEGVLSGRIDPHDSSDEPLRVQNVDYEGETLTFDLVEGEYGPMEARVEVSGDRFEGTMDVLNYNVTMPLTAEREK